MRVPLLALLVTACVSDPFLADVTSTDPTPRGGGSDLRDTAHPDVDDTAVGADTAPGDDEVDSAVDSADTVDSDIDSAVPADTSAPVDTGPADSAFQLDTGDLDTDAPASWVPTVASPCTDGPDAGRMATCAGGAAAYVGATGYGSLAAAVGAAATGATVVACPGVHEAPITVTHDLAIAAADPRPGATVVDGRSARTCLVHVHGDLAVTGLSFERCESRGVGAGITSRGDDLDVTCSTFVDDRAGYAGGAVAYDGHTRVTIARSLFTRNATGYEGGAVSTEGDAQALIDGCVFERDHAHYAGGAISLRGTSVVRETTFTSNHARYEGGAIAFATWVDWSLDIEDSTFTGNTAGYEGGAIDFGSWGHNALSIARTTFDDNHAGYSGGALELGSWGSFDLSTEDVDFAGNVAPTGGAVDAGGWLDQGGHASLVRTTMVGNAGSGSAWAEGGWSQPITIEADDLVVLRNVGGPAFAVKAHDQMSCTSCDFGAGADDNQGGDVSRAGYGSAPSDFSF